jgi:hypothetical protein
MSTNNDRNGGNTPSACGDNTSTIGKLTPPKQPENDAHFEGSGDIGASGDTFRLSLGGGTSTTVPLLDGNDYVAFDLEWPDSFYRFYKVIPMLTDPEKFDGLTLYFLQLLKLFYFPFSHCL